MPRIRELAMSLTNQLQQRDWRNEVRALHGFVRDQIRWVNDRIGAEVVQTPEKTLEIGTGNSDDKATLLATLLLSIGHPTRFVAVGVTASVYSRIYVETRIGSRWIRLDTTEAIEIGWSPAAVKARMEYPIK